MLNLRLASAIGGNVNNSVLTLEKTTYFENECHKTDTHYGLSIGGKQSLQVVDTDAHHSHSTSLSPWDVQAIYRTLVTLLSHKGLRTTEHEQDDQPKYN